MAGCGRSDADAVLAAALASGRTVVDAARAAGVSERTARRRVQDPDFGALVGRLRAEMVQRATGLLLDAASEATAALRRNLTCGQPAGEVRAASVILDHLLRLREHGEFEERLRALEAGSGSGGIDQGGGS
jgi:hypothetical protein